MQKELTELGFGIEFSKDFHTASQTHVFKEQNPLREMAWSLDKFFEILAKQKILH